MKIEVYTPQPQEEPVLRLKLRQIGGLIYLSEVDRDGTPMVDILTLGSDGIVLFPVSSARGLHTDERGRVRIIE